MDLLETPHREFFTTRYYELGPDRRIRVQSLCNYMEEAAGTHAEALGVGIERLMSAGITWVLAKMRLELEPLPGGGRKICIETWPVSVERMQFRRDFLATVEDGQDRGRIVARGVSQWVLVNLESRRLEKMTEEISLLRPSNPRKAVEDGDIRIPAVFNAMEGPVFPIRLSDIDHNRHVNNNRYIDFVLESADGLFVDKAPAGIDLIFRAEGIYGDVIGTHIVKESDNTLLHSLYRVSDGQEMVRARTVWK